ncbi:hypothetical protein BJ742DRAFT_683301, partial [Cladochytrium replicatum]
WKECGSELRYSDHAVDSANAGGHAHALDWWSRSGNGSGLELKYCILAMDCASKNRWTNVLKRWNYGGLVMHWSGGAMSEASKHGHTHLLDWWQSSGLKMK